MNDAPTTSTSAPGEGAASISFLRACITMLSDDALPASRQPIVELGISSEGFTARLVTEPGGRGISFVTVAGERESMYSMSGTPEGAIAVIERLARKLFVPLTHAVVAGANPRRVIIPETR